MTKILPPEVTMKKNNDFGSENSLQLYFDQIKDIPLLTFEEELELAQSISKGDTTARARLIESNLRLVVKISRSYLKSDISLMDLIQEGNVGLMRAVDKYDHRKQVRFSTYAAWWIRQAISRYLTDKRRIIRLPHRKEEVLNKIQRAYHTLSQLYMRQPKAWEIAAEIGVPKDDVEFILSLVHDVIACSSENVENGSPSGIEFHEDYTYSPEQTLMKKDSRESTFRILNHLKEREKRILVYRYQLNGDKHYTLKNIGVKMGLSTETVRQIEIKALQKLRSHAKELREYVEAV